MNHSPASKGVLVITPHYMGSLRYFEKLIPYISNRYEVLFLLLSAKRAYVDAMAEHCKEKGYRYVLTGEPRIPGFLKKFQFIYSVVSVPYFERWLKTLFETENIKKFVTVSDSSFYMRALYRQAKRRNIDAIILQWALMHGGQKDRPKKEVPLSRKALYRLGKPVYVFFLNLVMRLLVGNLVGPKTILGGGVSERFGVINTQAYDFFLSHGIPKEKMAVVGSLEFAAAEDTFASLPHSEASKKEVVARLGLDPKKKQVMLFSSPFNTKDIIILNDAEQLSYTESLVRMIRESLPADSYDISFKIHPVEDIRLYAPLESYGVKLFGKDANNAELIYASDLYVAHSTNTNFIAIMARKDAIFVNPFNLPALAKTAPFFGITEFVHGEGIPLDKRFDIKFTQEFKRRLALWKEGKLPKQYEYRDEIFTKNSAKKIVEWIG